MPHRFSPPALAARRLRAAERGFLRQRAPPGRQFIEVPTKIAYRVKCISRSLEVHARHCELAGRPFHFASAATSAVKDHIPLDETLAARRCHRAANHAKHCWGVLDAPDADPLWGSDPWAHSAPSHRMPPDLGSAHDPWVRYRALAASVVPPVASSDALRAAVVREVRAALPKLLLEQLATVRTATFELPAVDATATLESPSDLDSALTSCGTTIGIETIELPKVDGTATLESPTDDHNTLASTVTMSTHASACAAAFELPGLSATATLESTTDDVTTLTPSGIDRSTMTVSTLAVDRSTTIEIQTEKMFTGEIQEKVTEEEESIEEEKIKELDEKNEKAEKEEAKEVELKVAFAAGQRWTATGEHDLFYRPDGLPPRPYPSRRFRVLSVDTYGKYKGFLKVNFEECYPYFFGWLDPHADGVMLALVEANT